MIQQFAEDGATYYDYYDEGLAGDVSFYVQQAVESKGKVLEVGCGTGRILLPTAEKGIEIVGVEPSQHMISILQQKSKELPTECQEKISLSHCSFQQFTSEETFSLVTFPYRVFQHFLTPQEQRETLLKCVKLLAPEGKIVFNVIEPTAEEIHRYANHNGSNLKFDCRFTYPVSGNDIFVWFSRQYFPELQRIEQLVLFEEIDKTGTLLKKSYTPIVAKYSFQNELRYLFELCGLEVEAFYGDFTKKTYQYGDEQIWILKKKI